MRYFWLNKKCFIGVQIKTDFFSLARPADRCHRLRVPAAARLQELGQQRDRRAAVGHDQATPLQPRMLPPLLPRLGRRGEAGPDGGDPAP